MTYDKILRLQFRHDNAPRTPPTLPVSQVSIEKLLRYADRLRLQTSIAVRPVKARTLGTKSRAGSNARPVTKRVAVAIKLASSGRNTGESK